MVDEGDLETKEGMGELIASSQFDFNFSYGGNTISAEEMLVRAPYACLEIPLILVSFTLICSFPENIPLIPQ